MKSMKTLMFSALAVAFLASPAFAAKAARHCVAKDGTEIASISTAKACKASSGKWVKVKASTTKTVTKTKS